MPDETFEEALRRAQDLGMSRFFTRAAARCLDELNSQSLTSQIDQAVAALSGGDDTAEDAVVAGRRALDATPEW